VWVEGYHSAIGKAIRIEQSVKSVPDADEFPSQFTRRQGRSDHHGIQPWYEAAAHVDGKASCLCVHVILLYEVFDGLFF
jgi:hypothetical protein